MILIVFLRETSSRNERTEDCNFAHVACKLWPHYIEKFEKVNGQYYCTTDACFGCVSFTR